MLLKPSERVPGAAMIIARLAKEAGLPDGVLNIVHGMCWNKLIDDNKILTFWTLIVAVVVFFSFLQLDYIKQCLMLKSFMNYSSLIQTPQYSLNML